jgi:hypothetical protein
MESARFLSSLWSPKGLYGQGWDTADYTTCTIKNHLFLGTHLKFKIISQLGGLLAFKNKLIRQES